MSSDFADSRARFPLAGFARAASRDVVSARSEPLAQPLEGRSGEPLSEEAFRELLAIERARASRAGRPLRVLRVSLKPGPRRSADIKPVVAARLFAGLTHALRETDIIGWHREGRVAGAVLVDGTAVVGSDAGPVIVRRVRDVLGRRLPVTVASQLQLRVVRVSRNGATNGR
jgi:hypothetical protein